MKLGKEARKAISCAFESSRGVWGGGRANLALEEGMRSRRWSHGLFRQLRVEPTRQVCLLVSSHLPQRRRAACSIKQGIDHDQHMVSMEFATAATAATAAAVPAPPPAVAMVMRRASRISLPQEERSNGSSSGNQRPSQTYQYRDEAISRWLGRWDLIFDRIRLPHP